MCVDQILDILWDHLKFLLVVVVVVVVVVPVLDSLDRAQAQEQAHATRCLNKRNRRLGWAHNTLALNNTSRN